MRVTILLMSAFSLYAADGLQPLFDGKTLAGWKQCNGAASYTVAEGVLEGSTAKGSPQSRSYALRASTEISSWNWTRRTIPR